MSGAENTAAQIPLAPICSRGRSAQQHGLGGVAGVGAMGGGGIPLGGGVVAPDPRAYIAPLVHFVPEGGTRLQLATLVSHLLGEVLSSIEPQYIVLWAVVKAFCALQ